MKKILATILALTMIVGMSIVPAFAEENSANLGLGSQDITAKVTVNPAADPVADTTTKIYSVDVSWGEGNQGINFTYNEPDYNYVWNPNTLQYEQNYVPAEGDYWDADESYITVTNYSNADIDVVAKLQGANEGFTLENASFTLKSAAGDIADSTSEGEATSGAVKVIHPEGTANTATEIVLIIK